MHPARSPLEALPVGVVVASLSSTLLGGKHPVVGNMRLLQQLILQGERLGFGSLWLSAWPWAGWKPQLGVKQLL